MIKLIKRGYNAITKEHMIIFLVFLTAVILFNSFDFGYTSLTTREQCRVDYECCNSGDGRGVHYSYLDDSCLQRQGCYASCAGEQVGNKLTGGSFWSDFLDLFKRDVRGVGPGSPDDYLEQQVVASFPRGEGANGEKLMDVKDSIQLRSEFGGVYELGSYNTAECSLDSSGSGDMGSPYQDYTLRASKEGRCELRVSSSRQGADVFDINVINFDAPASELTACTQHTGLKDRNSYTMRYPTGNEACLQSFKTICNKIYVYDAVSKSWKAATEGCSDVSLPSDKEYRVCCGASPVVNPGTNIISDAGICARQKGLKLPSEYDYKGTGPFNAEQLAKFDIVKDGKIDDGDFLAFCNAYCTYDSRFDFSTDTYQGIWNGFDCKGKVDVYDYTQFIYAYGKTYNIGRGATPSCKGIIPDVNTAQLCSEDNVVTADVQISLVENNGCTPIKKCEYQCKPGFKLDAGKTACVPQTAGGQGAGGGANEPKTYEGFTTEITPQISRQGNTITLKWVDIFYNLNIDDNMLKKIDSSGNNNGVIDRDYFVKVNNAIGTNDMKFDFNGDNQINLGDLRIVELSFSRTIPAAPVQPASADVLRKIDTGGNKNNVVDVDDFHAFSESGAFGKKRGEQGYDEKFDYNSDGSVDNVDAALIENNIGRNIVTANVIASFAVLDKEEDSLWMRIKGFFKGLFWQEAVGVNIKPGDVSVKAYNVYRKIGNGDYVKLTQTALLASACAGGVCTYNDGVTAPAATTTYTYKIIALDGVNEVQQSEKISSIEYSVTPQEPVELQHTGVATAVYGRGLTITTSAKGGFDYLELSYKIYGETQYSKINFTPGDLAANNYRVYSVVIPAGRVVANVSYEIIARNAAGGEIKKTALFDVKVERLVENCAVNGDANEDGVSAWLDKECPGNKGGGYVGVKAISVSDSAPYVNMPIDVTCELNLVKASAADVANSKCVKVKVGGSDCGVNGVASGNNLKFNKCDSGGEGSNDVSCYVDTGRCNVEETSNRVNAKRNTTIEVSDPELCDDGVIGGEFGGLSNLKTDKSSYSVGERIKVSVDVSARGGEDLEDAVVMAGIYDIEEDDKPLISEGESEPLNVKKGARKGFTFYINTGKEDYKNDHRLFVALQADEPEVCVYSSKDINFKKASNATTTTTTTGGGLGEACVTGETRVCGSDIGLCRKGIQNCVRGVWTSCVGEIKGSREVCGDELDNDCNGNVDCDDNSCGNYAGCKLIPVDEGQDNDQDGLPDYWEKKYFTSEELYNADDDVDNDGFTNIQEYVGGSDPSDVNSKPEEGSYKMIFVIFGVLLVIVILVFFVFKYMRKPKQFKVQIAKRADEGNVKKIDAYIQSSLGKGYNAGQIKTALAIKGWTKNEIEEAFKRVK